MRTVAEALADAETVYAVACYSNMREALIQADGLSVEALQALHARAIRAAAKYPGEVGGPTQDAENAVLEAYARYLQAIMDERKVEG